MLLALIFCDNIVFKMRCCFGNIAIITCHVFISNADLEYNK